MRVHLAILIAGREEQTIPRLHGDRAWDSFRRGEGADASAFVREVEHDLRRRGVGDARAPICFTTDGNAIAAHGQRGHTAHARIAKRGVIAAIDVQAAQPGFLTVDEVTRTACLQKSAVKVC